MTRTKSQPRTDKEAQHQNLPGPVRLQKILAAAGLASRRGAEDLIRAGRVAINGVTVTELGRLAYLQDTITLDGEPIAKPQKLHYYMFHKPVGYLTALADPRGRAVVKVFFDHLPARVYPVGRLDRDVSGLLVLTNDGELARRLMHPSFLVPKVYRTVVKGQLTTSDLKLLSSGQLIIGDRQAAPATAKILDSGPDRGWLELTLTEGRHHQVKRMCSAVGHPVIKLKRVAYCGIHLDPALDPGEIRALTRREIDLLKTRVMDQDNRPPAAQSNQKS